MKKLIIDRSKWQRGIGYGELLNKADGKMCCLGIYLRACGKSPKTLAGVGTPADVPLKLFPKEAEWLLTENDMMPWPGQEEEPMTNSKVADRLMEVNDTIDKTEKQRESYIKREFAKRGIEVEFVGEDK